MHVCSAIEDLAILIRHSRESDEVGQRVCIEHDFSDKWKILTNTGTKAKVEESGINARSYAAAEKGDEGMALKILTRAEDMPDGKNKNGTTCMEIPRQILPVV